MTEKHPRVLKNIFNYFIAILYSYEKITTETQRGHLTDQEKAVGKISVHISFIAILFIFPLMFKTDIFHIR
jgi:hypothetical protein